LTTFYLGLIALFPLSFVNCAILHPLFFLAILHLIFFQLCFGSKSSLKEGKEGKRWGAKLPKKRRRGAKSHN